MRISDWSSDVCSSDLVGARRRVLALGLAEADQANIVARLEPRPDLQPGGACLAVDEYPRRHGLPRPLRRVSQKVQRTTQQPVRSEEHTSELQSLMRISYAVFCLNKKKNNKTHQSARNTT